MGVLEDLLCSFELLDPLDSAALKQVMKKKKTKKENLHKGERVGYIYIYENLGVYFLTLPLIY